MTRTRVLVADSLRIFRAGVRNLLARESDFLVTEAGTFDEVLQAIELECPDIALIDLDLPPFGGVGLPSVNLHMTVALVCGAGLLRVVVRDRDRHQ
jgi:DNA-binding NarL/FixJ family response regulator